MNNLYIGKIDISKIVEKDLFQGKKGIYYDISIWVNQDPDQFGYHIQIQAMNKTTKEKIYLGSAKLWQNTLVNADSLDTDF